MRESLVGSAMRCTSSFFFTAPPRPFAASMISSANFSVMVFPERVREYSTNQWIASDCRRKGLTSTGTW